MADGKRPGGLTALAVLNFVFGGLGALGVLALVALMGAASHIGSEFEKAGGTVTSSGPGAFLYVAILLSALSVALLLASGVGYIKMKRFLGRTLGTAYALLSIGSTIIQIAMLHTGFGVGTIIGLIYPALTLILVNTTFKDDLVN